MSVRKSANSPLRLTLPAPRLGGCGRRGFTVRRKSAWNSSVPTSGMFSAVVNPAAPPNSRPLCHLLWRTGTAPPMVSTAGFGDAECRARDRDRAGAGQRRDVPGGAYLRVADCTASNPRGEGRRATQDFVAGGVSRMAGTTSAGSGRKGPGDCRTNRTRVLQSSGEPRQLPAEFVEVVQAATLGSNCGPCGHSHFLIAPKGGVGSDTVQGDGPAADKEMATAQSS